MRKSSKKGLAWSWNGLLDRAPEPRRGAGGIEHKLGGGGAEDPVCEGEVDDVARWRGALFQGADPLMGPELGGASSASECARVDGETVAAGEKNKEYWSGLDPGTGRKAACRPAAIRVRPPRRGNRSSRCRPRWAAPAAR